MKPKVETPSESSKKPKNTKPESKDGAEASSSEEEKEEESPKPAFLRETLSGRHPKPPQRYEEKEKKRKRHKSSGSKSVKDSDSSGDESTSPMRTNTPGPYPSVKSPKKNEQLKIDVGSESEEDYVMKSPKKLSMSPKINIGPMIDSEKYHEKSRNSLWEAFITSREKTKTSKSPSASPRDTAEESQKKLSPPDGVKKAKIG